MFNKVGNTDSGGGGMCLYGARALMGYVVHPAGIDWG
jgi:hypothetical protein